MLSKFLYDLFLLLYSCGVHVAAIANPKARKWIAGRKGIFATINSQLPTPGSQLVWMHCASLGEFEQGRPLLEELKRKYPGIKILLTFFSPSGYEVMKGYTGADHVFYLPLDSKENAKNFLDAVNPALVLWVKYEYWYYYLSAIRQRNIPVLLVSGIFRKSQPFFKSYGTIWKKMLESFTHFFVQHEESEQLLKSIGFTKHITINGDTRFDRVLEIADNFMPVEGIAEFCGNHPVIVAGSTWEEDEIELLHFVNVNKHIKFIIAPHEIDKSNLKDVKDEFPDSLFYSDLMGTPEAENQQAGSTKTERPLANVLIIDNVGMLARLYKYATVAYVGGGFGAEGVHNVLEPAVYGKPVVFGPVYSKFNEATGLVNAGGAVGIDGGPVKLETILNRLLNHEEERKSRGEAARQYVIENAGASKKIMQYIQENRLLTN